MSNQLSTLNYQEHKIQSIIQNGEIFFRATQLAELLEYQNPHDAIKKHVDTDDLAKCEVIDSLGRKQKVNFVNESGMYSLILGSKQSSAKKIKKWVTSEVLPAIRKTGSYSLTINEEQKYLIKKAVNERVYRTGEKHQTIYHKLYDKFKVASYENLPSNQFENAIKFLGGFIQIQSDSITVNKTNLICLISHMKWLANFYREKRLYEVFKMLGSDFGVKTHDHILDGDCVAGSLERQLKNN